MREDEPRRGVAYLEKDATLWRQKARRSGTPDGDFSLFK